MKFAKGRNVAITAGLCAALTIGQTIAPVSQAFALSNGATAQKVSSTSKNVEFSTLNFRVAGETVSTVALPFGTEFSEFRAHAGEKDIVAPEGKVFVGWKLAGDPDEKLIDNAWAPKVGTKDVDAVFADAPVASHTVTFHAEDGTFLQTVEYKSDQAFGLFSEGIAPEKDGYEFAGWTYGDDTRTPVKADDVVTGDWHVYASYVKKDAPQAKVFKVTFWDGLTWTEDAVVEVEEGKTVAAPTDPACEGFKFEGWFVDKALKEAYDFSAPVNGDMVLYAKWSKTAEAPKDEQKPVTPSDKNAGLPQTGDASMVAMGFAAASGAVLSAAGYFSSKRRKH